ncbi:ABC transporter substrate-binding protein [Kribbella deserti]|uniref:Thiamine pyrimidine synthase n=1 Tax=Kribbella deserti TaxID=1926257 RepID=A0ABV6QKT6_9ACTN
MRLRRSVAALVVAMGLLVSACGGNPDSTSGNKGEKVSYLTSFGTFGREAYAYVALEKGYFRAAGLDVTITPGSGTVDVMKLVAGGQADYGVGDFTAFLITSSKQHLPVTTVGMIHQRSLAAIVALEGSGINKAGDLVGKKIGDQPGSTNQVMFPVYAKASGIDPKSVQFVPAAPPALPALLVSGQVNGIGQFVVGKPTIEKAAKGKKAVVLPYGDVLPDLYGNALLTRQDVVKENPEQVKKFTTALLKGLADTIADPSAAADILKKYVPETDVAVATAELQIMRDYVKPPSYTGPIGAIQREKVSTVEATLDTADALESDLFNIGDYVSFDLAPKA